MALTTHLWWYWGWFIIGFTTLHQIVHPHFCRSKTLTLVDFHCFHWMNFPSCPRFLNRISWFFRIFFPQFSHSSFLDIFFPLSAKSSHVSPIFFVVPKSSRVFSCPADVANALLSDRSQRRQRDWLWGLMVGVYPLVMTNIAMENGHL